jgi:hypothetical protein
MNKYCILVCNMKLQLVLHRVEIYSFDICQQLTFAKVIECLKVVPFESLTSILWESYERVKVTKWSPKSTTASCQVHRKWGSCELV